MKTSITHLPQDKQHELLHVVDTIVELVHPEMVILFGSFARGNWVNDWYVESGITYTYQSDFDLLVIVDNEHRIMPGLEGKIRRKAHREGVTPINVIFHEIGFVNKELEEGSYFFTDIKNEGIVLCDTGVCELAEPKELTLEETRKRVQGYFDYWSESANEFFIDYNNAFQRGSYNNAAFMLHQVTERYLVATLLVFSGYKPKTHDLNLLYRDVCRFGSQFKEMFPRTTNEENRLFNILQKAYIDARYKLNYTITKEELQYLSMCIVRLRNLTETACKKKIESFVPSNSD